jgi:hypothetical protein
MVRLYIPVPLKSAAGSMDEVWRGRIDLGKKNAEI